MKKFNAPPSRGEAIADFDDFEGDHEVPPFKGDHGVPVIGSNTKSNGRLDLVSAARTDKEHWLEYKRNSFVQAGKGKRRSLGLAPQKLLSLNFDPIEAKVMLAEKYEIELAYHEACREGLVLNPKTGEPRSYNPQAHGLVMAAYDRCINDLLRYGYARVPEKEDDLGSEIPPVTISLTLTEEDMDETINSAVNDGLIDNTENIRELVKAEIKNFKVPVKTFRGYKGNEDE
jgi:hypothetical protein